MATKDIRFAQPKAPREQLVLYAQSLGEMVPPDDPVRAFEALLSEIDWSPWEQAYTGYGQPPIHPRYLAGAILYGLLHRVRSSRDLEEAVRRTFLRGYRCEKTQGFTAADYTMPDEVHDAYPAIDLPDFNTRKFFDELRTRVLEKLDAMLAEEGL